MIDRVSMMDDQLDSQNMVDELFYPEPERLQCLNFLLHLAPYGDGVLLVTGAPGSGKTALIQQFTAKAPAGWVVSLIDASELEALAVFLRDLQQGFGFSLHGANDRAAKLEAFLGHLAVLHKRGQKPILVIDDAHLLSQEIIEFLDMLLGSLVGDSKGYMSLILMAEPAITTQSWYGALQRYGVHTYALNPLSKEETERLVQHELRRQEISPESVTPAQIKSIYKQSQGNVGSSRLLLKGLIGDVGHAGVSELRSSVKTRNENQVEAKRTMTKQTAAQAKKPIKFSRILFGMLTVLMVVVLYYQDEINEYFEPNKVVDQRDAPVVHSRERVQAPPKVEIPSFEQSAETSDEQALVEDEMPMHALPDADVVDASMSHPAGDAAHVQSVEVVSEAPLEQAPVMEEQAEEVVVAPAVAQEPEPEPVAAEVEKPEVVAAAKAESAGDPAMVRRESWVLEQNPEHYTLQIMSFTQELGVAKALAALPSKEKFFYFKYKKDGKTWYRLAYGVYSDRKAAQLDADKALPKELGKVDPWVRRIGDVQNEIKSQ